MRTKIKSTTQQGKVEGTWKIFSHRGIFRGTRGNDGFEGKFLHCMLRPWAAWHEQSSLRLNLTRKSSTYDELKAFLCVSSCCGWLIFHLLVSRGWKKSFFTEARKPKVIFRHLCRGIFTLLIIFTKNVRHNPLLSRWGEIRNIGIFYHLRQFPNVLLNFVGLLATHEGRWNEWKIPWKNIEFPSSVGKSLHAAPNFLLISPYRYVTFMFIHNHHFLFLVLIFFPARNFRIFSSQRKWNFHCETLSGWSRNHPNYVHSQHVSQSHKKFTYFPSPRRHTWLEKVSGRAQKSVALISGECLSVRSFVINFVNEASCFSCCFFFRKEKGISICWCK